MCPFSHTRAEAKADGDVWEGAIPASTDKSDPFVAANSAYAAPDTHTNLKIGD